MIYRLRTGAQAEWKKYLVSGLLVFMITAGFPVLGAWINAENLSLSPIELVQDDNEGVVLGDSTEQTDPNANPAIDPTASRRVNVVPTTSRQKLRTQSQPQPSATPVVPEVVPAPATPDPLPAITLPDPPSLSPPSPSEEPAAEGELHLEVDILDVVDAEVNVTPEVPPVLESVGL